MLPIPDALVASIPRRRARRKNPVARVGGDGNGRHRPGEDTIYHPTFIGRLSLVSLY
ncbi:MAG: hypothetical protein ACLQGP_30675 [Isosphaeraceae bacterium]